MSQPARPDPARAPTAPAGREAWYPASCAAGASRLDINGTVRRDREQTPVRPRAGPHTEGRRR
jgi:hypothetical protein